MHHRACHERSRMDTENTKLGTKKIDWLLANQQINIEQINIEQINKEQINKEQINKEQINKEQINIEQINKSTHHPSPITDHQSLIIVHLTLCHRFTPSLLHHFSTSSTPRLPLKALST